MEELYIVLEELRPDVDFRNESRLFTNRILDSFDIVTLVGELNVKFEIAIGVEDLKPENFDSAEAMWKLISRLKEEI
jgi:D-alanine--poly(phosphoribitol) ligase subunit 2